MNYKIKKVYYLCHQKYNKVHDIVYRDNNMFYHHSISSFLITYTFIMCPYMELCVVRDHYYHGRKCRHNEYLVVLWSNYYVELFLSRHSGTSLYCRRSNREDGIWLLSSDNDPFQWSFVGKMLDMVIQHDNTMSTHISCRVGSVSFCVYVPVSPYLQNYMYRSA